MATNISITHIVSLKGNAHIRYNTRYKLPNSNVSQSAGELIVENQEDSTRYGLQVSLLGQQNNLTLSMDAEEGQDVSYAYYRLSLGTVF